MSEPEEKKIKPSERLRSEQRIRKEWVFKFLFEQGTFVRGNIFHLWAYLDKEGKIPGAGPKIGFVVGKKTHLRANVRNLWKRRMREVFRLNQKNINPELVLLLQSRKAPKVPGLQEMTLEFIKLLKKTGSNA